MNEVFCGAWGRCQEGQKRASLERRQRSQACALALGGKAAGWGGPSGGWLVLLRSEVERGGGGGKRVQEGGAKGDGHDVCVVLAARLQGCKVWRCRGAQNPLLEQGAQRASRQLRAAGGGVAKPWSKPVGADCTTTCSLASVCSCTHEETRTRTTARHTSLFEPPWLQREAALSHQATNLATGRPTCLSRQGHRTLPATPRQQGGLALLPIPINVQRSPRPACCSRPSPTTHTYIRTAWTTSLSGPLGGVTMTTVLADAAPPAAPRTLQLPPDLLRLVFNSSSLTLHSLAAISATCKWVGSLSRCCSTCPGSRMCHSSGGDALGQ